MVLSSDSVPMVTTWPPEVCVACTRCCVDNEGKLRVWALDNDEHTLKKEVITESKVNGR